MRLWLKFERDDSLAFISHLDAHKAYYRMFRRAELPLAYSQGFNPHPVMSLAAPLPLGFQSRADYLDLTLSGELNVGDVRERLSTVSGQDSLRLLGVRAVGTSQPALAALIAWARYEITLAEGEVEKAVQVFLSAQEAPFVKETKRGTRQADAKVLVRSVAVAGRMIKAVLSLAEPVVFRPEEFVQVLSGLSATTLEIELISREELYVRGEGMQSPLECEL